MLLKQSQNITTGTTAFFTQTNKTLPFTLSK